MAYNQGLNHTRYVYLNSKDQVRRGSFNNQAWEIEISQSFDRSVSGFLCSVQEMNFMNTHPTIHKYNKYIYFVENGGATPNVTLTAALVEGTYVIDDFALAVETALNAATGTATGYTVTIDDFSYQMIITQADGIDFTLQTSTDAGRAFDYTPYHIMGYDTYQFKFATSLVGDGIVDLSGSKYIDIVTNLPTHNSSTNGRAPLLRVALDAPPNTFFSFFNSDTDYLFVNDNGINVIKIELFDDRGAPFVIANNSFISMTLKLVVVAHPETLKTQ